MLSAINIHKYYGKLQVLKGVNLVLQPGEVVALVGASGAGKSTLLQIMGLLDEPDMGQVMFEGKNLVEMKEWERAEFRSRKLGFVFQFHHLLPEFNALENVMMPALIAGMSTDSAEKRAMELLAHLHVEERATHKPSELSGGEQQRVAVARSLINKPGIILADEPTGNLDSKNSEVLFDLIRSLSREFGVGVLVTTHNEALANASDRRLRILDGVIQ